MSINDKNQNLPEYPEFLQKLVVKFKPQTLQHYIDKTTTVRGVKLKMIVRSALSALLRGMVSGESLLSAKQTHCSPSINQLRKIIGSSETTLRKSLRLLECVGIIEVIETVDSKSKRNNNNIYRISELLFLEWALSLVRLEEEKAYIATRIESLLAKKMVPRISVLNGQKGFLQAQKNLLFRSCVALAAEKSDDVGPLETAISELRAHLIKNADFLGI